ncbi:hypothetical protein EK21DRAFT_104855 [Setomelanomma holmii]|uniref:Major facilitator superfamily (MFS) profile domain-containing protein n=1 Tax=Setomelanomma holmii TaxID=210430 RepID=A0A9P4GZ75_9PLEO|nr:hypothetical protein EK21DRAFT_104855 [Setomelanomma holmii]
MTDKEAQQPVATKIVGSNEEAQHAAADEKSMTLMQAIKLYPKAVGYRLAECTVSSTPLNTVSPSTDFLSSNGARAGEVIVLIINSFVSERYGYRKTMIGALMSMTAFIFILFFAPNVQALVIGEVFCGIPWGMLQTLTTQYASEVAPVHLRPILTTFVNMCCVIGQFIASGVNRACVQRPDQWAYRIPFAIQWIWPVPIMIGVFLAPETGARAALRRLTSPDKVPDFNADETIAMIEHTNELEKSMTESTSWFDLFKGTDLRRTEIVCFAWIVQTICGTNVMGYFAYFMQRARLPTVQSFNMSMISLALGLVSTMGSWFLMQHLGRRTIHISGACKLFVILIIVGSCSCAGTQASNWAIGGILILFGFVYDFTIGLVTYSIVSEMSSTRLKAKTIVLARALYNIFNIVVNVLTNYQLGDANWAWGAKTAFFSEPPKGRTYGELDMLFEQNVSARKFASTQVDPYGQGHGLEARMEEKEVAKPEWKEERVSVAEDCRRAAQRQSTDRAPKVRTKRQASQLQPPLYASQASTIKLCEDATYFGSPRSRSLTRIHRIGISGEPGEASPRTPRYLRQLDLSVLPLGGAVRCCGE